MLTNDKAEPILHLFRTYGHIIYGEHCSVLSHSVQAGWIAKEKGHDEELVLAAFLHDIGHLVPFENSELDFKRLGEFGIEAHDLWGAKFLERSGFSQRIIATVKNHVASKRYLCYREKAYFGELSDASKETLNYQGGPMSATEAAAFEKDPFFKDSIAIRRIDDAAKSPDFEVTEEHWEYFTFLLEQV